MKNFNEINETLQAIGLNLIRVMAIQAAVRLTGEATPAQINAAYAEMVLSTRLAGKTLRELSGAALEGDQQAEELLSLILPGKLGEIKPILNHLNDGHLALNFCEPAQTVL